MKIPKYEEGPAELLVTLSFADPMIAAMRGATESARELSLLCEGHCKTSPYRDDEVYYGLTALAAMTAYATHLLSLAENVMVPEIIGLARKEGREKSTEEWIAAVREMATETASKVSCHSIGEASKATSPRE